MFKKGIIDKVVNNNSIINGQRDQRDQRHQGARRGGGWTIQERVRRGDCCSVEGVQASAKKGRRDQLNMLLLMLLLLLRARVYVWTCLCVEAMTKKGMEEACSK